MAVEVLHLEAAQLGQQGKEAAKLLQHAHAALQHRAVQPQGRAHPGRLCQPAVCLLLGQSQIELWGRGTPAAGHPPTPTPENASHPGRGAEEGVSTLAKAMHFHSLMFSENASAIIAAIGLHCPPFATVLKRTSQKRAFFN